jgi:hypothetical protein
MVTVEAEELGRFRRRLAEADLEEFFPVIAGVIDESVDLLRGHFGSSFGIEMLAAVAAELHRRADIIQTPPRIRTVGNA